LSPAAAACATRRAAGGATLSLARPAARGSTGAARSSARACAKTTAATAAGKTYDTNFLLRADTHGIRPDPAAAATWYRKAATLGDMEARTLLAHLEVQAREDQGREVQGRP
jgi:TPR repeat protein